MVTRTWIACIFLFGLLTVPFILCDEADIGGDDEGPAEDAKPTPPEGATDSEAAAPEEPPQPALPPQHPDTQAVAMFPEFPDAKFLQGKPIEVLVGFNNGALKPLNVTRVQGSLHSPYDYSYYFQNFTAIEPLLLVAPGEQVTFQYKLHPERNIEQRDYVLDMVIFYEDTPESLNYSITFVNKTIEFVESPGLIDTKRAFTYFAVCATVVLAGTLVYNSVKSKKAHRRAAKRETGTESGVDMDWLSHIPLQGANKDAKPRKSSGRKTR